MNFVSIITIIIQILTQVLQFISGGGLNNIIKPKEPTAQYAMASSANGNCQNPYWVSPVRLDSQGLSGTVAINCKVKANFGGGLEALAVFLERQLNVNGSQIAYGPVSKWANGMNSEVYGVTLALNAGDGNTAYVNGESTLSVSDAKVVNAFKSISIPQKGALQYVQNMSNKIEVTPSLEMDTYNVTFQQTTTIEPPVFGSALLLKNAMITRAEQEIRDRSSQIVNDLSERL